MKITVFTPTYNRAYVLDKLYESLRRQRFRDFEWLVVDDGSRDETGALVARWQSAGNDFPIRYYYQENGGKHRAINHGLERAAGELFFTVDSDDYLTEDALEKVAAWEASIAGQPGFCGVAGNLGTAPDRTPNRLLNLPFWDGDLLARYPESRRAHHIDGERALVFYTAIHRKYPYPEFPGENFLTEAVAWNRMAADGWQMRFFDDIIWIYEYMPDGLTQRGFSLFSANPRGYVLWQQEKCRMLTPGLWNAWKCSYSLYCDLREDHSPRELRQLLGPQVWSTAAVHWLKNPGKRNLT